MREWLLILQYPKTSRLSDYKIICYYIKGNAKKEVVWKKQCRGWIDLSTNHHSAGISYNVNVALGKLLKHLILEVFICQVGGKKTLPFKKRNKSFYQEKRNLKEKLRK